MAFLAADGQQQLAPIEARLGDLELWEITNVDTQDHVFHLHTWPFQVWRRDGVEAAIRAGAIRSTSCPASASRS